MGFYGKVANSNKTAFSFDRVYSSRIAMDAAAENDLVFIGRYVLIEYDEPPITGYYSGADFYSSMAFQNANKLTPREGIIYQDLLRDKAPYTFYYWNGSAYAPATNAVSAYAASYNRDVLAYGRGYDSTAWMKTYDTTKNKYRYVLVAELNTIVPNFHLLTDPPSNVPAGVYFDRDTTGVDYYMHQQAEWGQGMRLFTKVRNYDNQVVENAISGVSGAKSDEEIQYVSVAWGTDVNGHQYFNRVTNNIGPGDIYYNKDGFNKETHTMSHSSIKNAINYTYDKSGRLYGGGLNDSEMTWNRGQEELDMMEWYIHLPAIGDAICTVWDTLYGYNSLNQRYTALSTQRSDPGGRVTYNVNTALGAINKIKDLMGWIIKEKESSRAEGSTTNDRNQANFLYYTKASSANKEEPVIDKYFYYAYDPLYVEATTTVTTNPATGEKTYTFTYGSGSNTITGGINDVFFKDTDGKYKRPNLTDWPATLSNGTTIGSQYNKMYLAQDRWKLIRLTPTYEDTIYGLIIKLHRLMGDYSPDVRDPNSIQGCINLMNDMIANISRNLAPYKMIVTNQNGQMITSNIEYPYFNTMSRTINGQQVKNQELLDSAGNWRLPVNYRLYTLNLRNASNPNKYFDGGYYGNSCLHAVLETDMLGEAIKKMQNEMADIQYVEQAISSFTAKAQTEGESNSSYIYVENGRNITDVTLSYTLNKGPRQNISLTRTNPTRNSAVYSSMNIPPEYYVTNPTEYAASKSNTLHDTLQITASGLTDATIRYRLSVTDERSKTVTKDATIQYCNKAYWGVGSPFEAALLNTYTAVRSAFSNFANGGGSKLATAKFSPSQMTATGANTHIYWMQPSNWSDPIFRIGGFEGGMDYLGTVQFTNAYNYTREYKVWRSTNTNLGSTSVVIS